MELRGRTELPKSLRRQRAVWSRVGLLVVAGALAFALVQVQIVSSEAYAIIAKENRLRPLVVRAPRGTIFDRQGRVVAENVVGYEVSIMPAPMDSMMATLERLRPVLGLTDRDIQIAVRRYQRAPHLPMEVKRDTPAWAIARLQERRHLFPAVLVHEYPRRRYATASISHIVGYVAEISREELDLPEFAGYRQGRWIGKAGLERSYERIVGGEPGVRYLEVDALGRILRWMPEQLGLPPIPGRDLQLTLDLDLQRYIEEIFPAGMTGAFVAIDPRSGGILAMYSRPGYDPNVLVGGVEPDVWAALSEDPTHPLLNRALASPQPPGSTFKLATAVIALSLGAITPDQYMPIPCAGGIRYERRFARCWYGRGHGYQNLVGAIKNSCNVYFYQVGIRVGFEKFLERGARIGFGGPTGVDLPNELASTYPPDRQFWQDRFGYRPYDNEVMSLTIGQGAVNLTPLKLAQIFVGIAREDGRAPVPHLVVGDSAAPVGLDLGIDRDQIEAMRRGMRRVVGPGGTAHLSRLPHWDFMGKTGTAQNPHGPEHGIFVGIGGPPGGEPEIVAAMLLEHGMHGYTASGYVANAVNFFLSREHGMPFERFPTPRDRLPRGLSVDWRWFQSQVEDPPRP